MRVFGVPPSGGNQSKPKIRRRKRRMLHSILLIPALSATACAADIPTPSLTLDETTNTSPPAQTQPNATGDWLGIRPALEKTGLTIGGLLELDTTHVVRGGVDSDSTLARCLFDLNLTLDTDAAFHWPGGTLFFDFQSHDGSNASAETVGDIQGFDNLDAAHFVQIYQLWYQQKFAGDMFRVKAGKIDANADFSVIEHGKEFLHSAATYSTTIFPIVTYPDPAPGADFFFKPADAFYAGIGAFYSNRKPALPRPHRPSAIYRALARRLLPHRRGRLAMETSPR